MMVYDEPGQSWEALCDHVKGGACDGGHECLYVQGSDDDGTWYVEVAPDGIAYTFHLLNRIPF